MLLMDAYVSLSEESLLGGKRGVAVVVPESKCGLFCVFCYLRGAEAKADWTASQIADWALGSGACAMEWCGWPPLKEAREVYEHLAGRMRVILKTSGADDDRLPDLLNVAAPFFDVYVPDMKFGNSATADLLAQRASYVDQSQRTLDAIGARFCGQLEVDGLLMRGVLVRHLMLPGFRKDTMKVIERFARYAKAYEWPLSLVDAYMPQEGIKERAMELGPVAHALTGMMPREDRDEARRAAIRLGIRLA